MHQDNKHYKNNISSHFFLKWYIFVLMKLKKIVHLEAFSGVILIICTAFALIWANSPLHNSYTRFWHTSLGFSLENFTIKWDLHFWVNDVLMTFFFLIAGLEIKKEIYNGALSSIKQATLPIVAAFGGVIAPAIIYILINNTSANNQGWAIPTATDIAFAVGILAIIGRNLPRNIHVILLSLAIIDDIIAVLIITFFYSNNIDAFALLMTGAAIAIIYLFQKMRISSAFIYALPASLLWFGLCKARIHPSLAGVILGLLTPIHYQALRLSKDYQPYKKTINPLAIIKKRLYPWVTFLIMPLFALANAGIYLGDIKFTTNGTLGITFGIIAGLLIGKPLGIILTSLIAVKMGLCRLPVNVNWGGMILIGLLAGIGFTMAIFVAMLAFTTPEKVVSAKLGVLLGSGLSASFSLIYGFLYSRHIKTKNKIQI